MTNESDLSTHAVSATQESLWLVDSLARRAGAPVYHEPLGFRITGDLDPASLRAALAEVVARHETLRTSFSSTSSGLRGTVHTTVSDVLSVTDLRDAPGEQARARGEELLAADYRRPFDLATGPLIRAICVLLPGREALLGLTLHHLATDGWSNTVVLDELGRHYRSLVATGQPATLLPLKARFAEHVRREQEAGEAGAYGEAIEYWRKALSGGPELLRLPLDFPRPAMQTFVGSGTTLRVLRAELAPVLERCRTACRSTDFTVLLAAYALLLHRYCGQDEVTVGTTVLNRPSEADLDVVGCFVNTAALPVRVDEGMTFRELLARTGGTADAVLDHGHVPYPQVLEALDVRRDPSHNPVFQTMLTVLGRRPELALGDGLTIRRHEIRRSAAKFDILLYVAETADGFEFEAEYDTGLFAASTIERLLRHYARLLTALPDHLDTAVSDIPFLPDEERIQILDDWNATERDYPWTTVVDLFEAQARTTPDAIAVDYAGRTLTYRELDHFTNRLARRILDRRAGAEAPFVGVYLDRSLEMVAALVAIVKAGCAYVPIDPEYPADRVAFMIEDSAPSLVLTQQHHRARLDGGPAQVLVVSADEELPEDNSPVERHLTGDSPVYMIYTSGSTGRPKGVVNRHVSLFNRLYWMQEEYGLTGEDRVLQKTPFSFDVSVWEFFWPLMSGARIVVAKPGGHKDTDYLKRLIAERGVTTVHFIPSILNVFLEEEDLTAHCGSLRRVICSGEALPFAAVEKFERLLSCGLHNLYGPTEAAIDVSHWPCTTDYPGSIVPIGRPIANVRLYVLDRSGGLAPIGVPGELCIGGVGVAAGYHNRDELTAERFVPDPYGTTPGARMYRTGDLARFLPDGQLQYLGRLDNQIKLRGVRIEPEEVAAALLELPGVRDATVVLREFGVSRALVGYVVADDPFDPAAAKEVLAGRLPEFMVPQAVVVLPAFPTTANGKLDRKALPDPRVLTAPAEVPAEPPATDRERELAAVWAEVLGSDPIGVEANFFRHGGDSILSIRVTALLRERGYPVQVHDLFAHPTIRQLAEVLEPAAESPAENTAPFSLVGPADRAALPADVVDAWPLTTLQAGMIYHTMRHEDSPVYHDVFTYELSGDVRPGLLRQAIAEVVNRHPQLRSGIDLATFGEPLQLVRAGTVAAEVTDLTGHPAAEQDTAVARWAARERRRPFDLVEGPLVRFAVHVRSASTATLGLSFHHAVLDGWSVAVVVDEIRGRCAELAAGTGTVLPPEPGSYATYVDLERKAIADPAHQAHWAGLAAGVTPTLLSIVDDTGVVARTATAGRVVPVELERAADVFAAGLGVPVKSAHLAIHLKVLAQLTGRNGVVTGLVSAGRPETTGGAEQVGLFLNTLPVPLRLRAESWAALARRVLAAEQASLPFRRFPLAEVQRLAGGTDLFDTVFNYTDFHVHDAAAAGVRIIGADYFEQTSFPVVVHVHRDHFAGRLRVFVNHDTTRVPAEIVERYLDGYLSALAELATGEDRPAEDAAGTDLERRIAAVVAEAVGVSGLAGGEDYLDLGLDSISAIRVVARLRRIDRSVSMADVFGARTAGALAARLGTGTAVEADEPELRPFELAGGLAGEPGVVDAYPATALQLDMIRATDREPAQAAFHDVFTYRVPLRLREEPLRAALRRTLNTHEVFRTSFRLEHAPALQVVHDSVEPCLEVVEDADAWFEAERACGFAWAEPGLIRFAAQPVADAEFLLVLGFHHAILDGWSLSLFIRELDAAYRAELAGEPMTAAAPPPVRFREHVRAEMTAAASTESRDFWTGLLAGTPEATFPAPAPQAVPVRWSEEKLVVGEARHQALTAAAARCHVPLKYVLLAAHLRALGLLTGQDDVVTGVFTHGRPETDRAEEAIGMFLNFLPLRQEVADRPWAELARGAFDAERRALPHRRFPQAAIRAATGRERLFQALFNYTRFTAYQGVVTGGRWFEHVDVPLLVNAGHDLDGEHLVLTINADGRVFPPARLCLVAELYDEVLTALAAGVPAASRGVTALLDEIR